jgi:HlyD family secretion protein
MDIKRADTPRRKTIQRLRLPLFGLLGIACAALAITLRNPSLPELDKRVVVTGLVQRGEMLRRVRGPGNLVARDIRWLTARTPGRVDRVYIEAGEAVTPETVLLSLANPEIEQQVREALLDLKAAEAEHQALLARLEDEQLSQHAVIVQIEADRKHAQFRHDAESSLEGSSAVSLLDLEESRLLADQLQMRKEVEDARLEALPRLHDAQISASSARLELLRERLTLQQELESSLQIRAGIEGVVQDLSVEQGQRVTVGAVMARVANPLDLKAELRISEIMAREVAIQQSVSVDTRHGVVEGRVTRIDPAVENGTVTVDVRFSTALPESARMAQSVDAVIEIERLSEVVYIERPSGVQATSSSNLFVLGPDSDTAARRSVRLGRSSVNQIEIIEGLAIGDEVILSDTSNYTQFAHIRLQ